MSVVRYAIYPPAEPSLPFLAVVLEGSKLLDLFACPDRQSAAELLGQLRARHSGRTGGWADLARTTQPVEFATLYRLQPGPQATPATVATRRDLGAGEVHGETGERASSSRLAPPAAVERGTDTGVEPSSS